MSLGKKESKHALLLSPFHVQKTVPFIESLLIVKDRNGISYQIKPINRQEINYCYSKLPAQAKDVLLALSAEGIEKQKNVLKQRLQQQKAGVSKEVYMQVALKRFMHEQLEMLKPLSSLIKWYHKQPSADGKHLRMSPCSISSFKPTLSFELSRQDGILELQIKVILNHQEYPLSTFYRFDFLLFSNNEYFLLGFKDYQTLEWLQQNLDATVCADDILFKEKILSRLEADYSVNRNDVFETNSIAALPEKRILLSELNDAFLLFTPQWMYEGFLIEGPFTETTECKSGGELFTIIRNQSAEQELNHIIEALHPSFPKQKNGYYYLSFADAQRRQWFLKAYYKLLDAGIDITGMDMLKHFRYAPYKPETQINFIREEGSYTVLEMQVKFGEETIPLQVLQKTLLAGGRAVMLADGSLGVFSDEWMYDYALILKHAKTDKDTITVSKFLMLTGQYDATAFQAMHTSKKEWMQKWQEWQQSDTVIYQLPVMVQATLRPYQHKGFEFMALLYEAGAGVCLADDMGLGKTLQTICFLAYYIERHPHKRNIIIAPSSLIYNWQQELSKFLPQVMVLVYHGNARKDIDLQNTEAAIIITSYGTLRADKELFAAVDFGVAVVDESHSIRNPSAQITQSVNVLNAVMRIALSGTPVVNNSFDLYAQFNFILPGLFGSKEFFRKEYAEEIDRYRNEEKIKALQKITAPFILRRTKEQVAKDLPAKTESILWCNMSVSQQMLYNEIRDQIRSSIFTGIQQEGLNKSKLAVLQGMLKLRQICNSALLLSSEERNGCTDSVKTTVLIEELMQLGNHKAIVFSQFTSMLDLLAENCTKKQIPFYHFDGSTPPAKRAEMVAAFQEEKNDTKVFLISLKAGNTGLTLTAADYVFLFDPWWNNATEQQAIDRTHRIGQTKNVFAYKMICRNTIEEKIIELQNRKKMLADDLITEDEGFVKNLDEADIAYLFS